MAFGDRVRKTHRAVKFVSTPEDWATANQMLVIDPDDNMFMITVSKIKPGLIYDTDRKQTIKVRNLLIKSVNYNPINWWLNYRVVTGIPHRKEDDVIIPDVKNITYFKE